MAYDTPGGSTGRRTELAESGGREPYDDAHRD